MKINVCRLGACLALLPLAALAQSTVFHTTFGSDTLNQASFTPTSTSTAWNIASSKNASASSVSSSGLVLSMVSTSAGVVEAQTKFTAAPVTLTNVNDYLTVTAVFTATNNILTLGTGSRLYIGLYNSAGSSPLATLGNTGLTTGASDKTTGGTVGWTGYTGLVNIDGGSSAIVTRPVQNTGTLANAAQDLAYNGSGGYNYPAGVNVASSSNAAATALLTNGNQYTLSYTITLTAANTYSVATYLYDGVGVAVTNLATISGTATGANFLTSSFDGLMIGERFQNSSGSASSMTITDVAVSTNAVSAVPEPSTYAALAGVAALGFVTWRRRRAG